MDKNNALSKEKMHPAAPITPQRGLFARRLHKSGSALRCPHLARVHSAIRLKTGHETRALACMEAFESDNNSGLMRMGLLACYASNAFTTSVTVDTVFRDNCHDSPFQLARYFVTADRN